MSPISHSFHSGCEITGLTLLIYEHFSEKEAINPFKASELIDCVIIKTNSNTCRDCATNVSRLPKTNKTNASPHSPVVS